MTDPQNDDNEMTDEQLADASGGAVVFSDKVDVKAVIF